MIINNDHIISWKIWQPLIRLFHHCIRVSRDGGHVNVFIKVIFPRVIHWRKGKATMKKGFDNERLEGRLSLVNFRRFEPPWG
jgi:hypothetical protein